MVNMLCFNISQTILRAKKITLLIIFIILLNTLAALKVTNFFDESEYIKEYQSKFGYFYWLDNDDKTYSNVEIDDKIISMKLYRVFYDLFLLSHYVVLAVDSTEMKFALIFIPFRDSSTVLKKDDVIVENDKYYKLIKS